MPVQRLAPSPSRKPCYVLRTTRGPTSTQTHLQLEVSATVKAVSPLGRSATDHALQARRGQLQTTASGCKSHVLEYPPIDPSRFIVRTRMIRPDFSMSLARAGSGTFRLISTTGRPGRFIESLILRVVPYHLSIQIDGLVGSLMETPPRM